MNGEQQSVAAAKPTTTRLSIQTGRKRQRTTTKPTTRDNESLDSKPTTTTPEEDQDSQQQQQEQQLLTPHILRLLKLVEEGTVEHAHLAATHLSEITAGSSTSPVVLWDILGRLQGYLTSPEWKTRQNASLAMEGVARHLPLEDQRDFLEHGAVTHRDRDESEQGHPTGWLTLADVKEQLSTILERGRNLLSTSETNYDQQLEQEEAEALEQLDQTAGEKLEFIQRRVQLQRRILARRLGLSDVLIRVGTKEVEESVLSMDDLTNGVDHEPPTKKRLKNPTPNADVTKSIRALLVMEVRQQQHQRHPVDSFRTVSHRNAQCLLATELVFRMFDASWYVRHGSLMGIMALMRAWKVHETSQFGIWPQDIMSRCLCILGLDRFADYSETATSSESGGIVAPVREMASRVFAILYWAAPEAIQRSSFDSIVALSVFRKEDAGSWEIRHAALLALKYIFALISALNSELPATTDWTNELSDQVLELAIASLNNDANHDTRGMAAQLLVVCLNTEMNQRHSRCTLVSRILDQLWGGISPSILISSTVKDVVTLLDILIRIDFRQVLAGIPASHGGTGPCSSLFSKLELLTTAPYLSVKVSAVALIGKVSQELDMFLADDAAVDLGKEARLDIANSFCNLIWAIFRLRFDGGIQLDGVVSSKEELRFSSVCAESWLALARSSKTILGDAIDLRSRLDEKILLTYFGFPIRGHSLSGLESSTSLTAASFGRYHRFRVDVADAVAVLLSESGSLRTKTQSYDMLLLFLRVSSESPLLSHFERGCFLFTSLSSCQHKRDIRQILDSSREWFVSAMQGGTMRRSLWDPKRVRDIAVTLQQFLGKALEPGLESLLNGRGSFEETASQVLALWGEVTGRFDTGSETLSASLDSMRLSVLITGALLAGGVVGIPDKLTPWVRALVTSVQNEADPECQKSTVGIMTKLLRILFEDAAAPKDRQTAFGKTRGKIIHNLCTIIKSRVEPGCTIASMVIGRVAGSVPKPVESLGGIWDEVEPIRELHAMDGKRGLECVVILNAVCSDLSNKSTGAFVVKSFCRSLISIRCTTSDDAIKCYTSQCLEHMGHFDHGLLLEEALPTIALMCTSEADAVRSQACEVLFETVNGPSTALCPYVRSLLPLAMRLMTDPSTQVSKAGARVFSTLVQLAPLVKESAILQLLPDSGSEKSDQVMDHLIQGQPLPQCEIHPKVRDALEAAGVQLRAYQLDGITWLRFLQQVGLNGALTDAMGLGKTVQALVGISLAHFDAVDSSNSPISLVVCPSSVLGHWAKEVSRFFPGGTVLRHCCIHGHSKNDQIPGDCNLVITSYTVLRSEIDVLSRRKWTYVVLDEGHLLKNPKTATAKAVRRLQSRFKLILTGTPVQNKVNEVWAAFDFLMPNFLGSSADFSREFAKPISKGQAAGAGAADIALMMEKLKLLHQQVLPFILRREKEHVLKELPPKVMTTIPCEMSSRQLHLYQNFCLSGQGQSFLGSFRRVLQNPAPDTGLSNLGPEVLKAMLYLRLVCTHPALVDVNGIPSNDGSQVGDSGKLLALKELFVECGLPCQDVAAADNDMSLLYIRADESDEEAIDDFEGVLDASETDPSYFTEQRSDRRKCLVFAQFTSSLDVVEELLHHHFPAVSYLRLDGKVPVSRRGEIVDSFNSDEHIKILLLTTRIGGLGLNLTGADTVIFLEHDWNPHADLQAMDRAHRIGQERTVNVYKLVTKDSIEEKIMQLHETKLAMSNAIVNAENSTMYSMGTDQLLDIFRFRSEKSDHQPKDGVADHILDILVERYEDEYESLNLAEFINGFKTPNVQSQS